jgi:hypothetical protein
MRAVRVPIRPQAEWWRLRRSKFVAGMVVSDRFGWALLTRRLLPGNKPKPRRQG